MEEGESKMARMTTKRERKSLKELETLYIRKKAAAASVGWRLSGSSAGRRLVGFWLFESQRDVDGMWMCEGQSGMELT